MTVLGTRTTVNFICQGSSRYDLPFDFLFLEPSTLVVTRTIDDVEQELVLGVDYTVSGGNGNSGFIETTLVYNSGFLNVYRDTKAVQLYDARVGDGFNTDTFEQQLDRMIMIIQETDTMTNNAIHLDPTVPRFVSRKLPDPEPHKYIRWNSLGTKFENVDGVLSIRLFTPRAGQEYPDLEGITSAALWILTGLLFPYTWQTGDLAGQTGDNSDFMVWTTRRWWLVDNKMRTEDFYRLDGTQPLMANFAAGGYRLTNVADAIQLNDAVTLGQFDGVGDHFVNVTGDEMTGNLTVGTGQSDAHINIQATDSNGETALTLNDETGSPRGMFYVKTDTDYAGIRKQDASNATVCEIELKDDGNIGVKLNPTPADDYDLTTKSYVDTEMNAFIPSAEFLDSSAGVPDAGKPILLNSAGQIDPSMIDTSIFYFVGEHDPSGGTEYPDTTGEVFGAFWVVTGLTADYTFTGGDLTGRTVANGDFMIWSAAGWSIMAGEMNPALYYRLDGSYPLTDHFRAGTKQLKDVADGVDATDGITLGQANGLYLLKGEKAADSELLDGRDSADFANASHNHNGYHALQSNPFVVDCNTQVANGFYATDDNTLNCPSGETWGELVIFGNDSSLVGQIFISSSGNSTYVRSLSNAVWSAWTKLADSGDSVNPDDFVKKIGDTMTGNLAIKSASGEQRAFVLMDSAGGPRAAIIFDEADNNVYINRYDDLGDLRTQLLLTASGNVTVNAAAPSDPEHLTRKDYVDDNFYPISGGTVQGSVSSTGNVASGAEVTAVGNVSANGDVIADAEGQAISLLEVAAAQIIDVGGYKNKIINGDMRVNQRAGTYSSSGIYTLDRWRMTFSAGSMTVTQQSSSGQTDGHPDYLTKYLRADIIGGTAAGDYSYIGQRIEGAQNLAGGPATVSFWARTDAGQQILVSGDVNYDDGGANPPEVIPSILVTTETGWAHYHVTIDIPPLPAGGVLGANSYLEIEIHGSNEPNGIAQSIVLDITGVQVEEGPYPSAFEQRAISTEIAMCQRYYRVTDLGLTASGTPSPAGEFELISAFPHETALGMRASPTVTITGFPDFQHVDCIDTLGTLYENLSIDYRSFVFNGDTIRTHYRNDELEDDRRIMFATFIENHRAIMEAEL